VSLSPPLESGTQAKHTVCRPTGPFIAPSAAGSADARDDSSRKTSHKTDDKDQQIPTMHTIDVH